MKRPPFNTFPELQDERILLREAHEDEVSLLFEILTYDGRPAETLEEGRNIFSRIHQNYLDGDTVNWVIEQIETKEMVGFVGYYRGFKDGIGELGCILKAGFRGKGFMSPALRLAAKFGIEEMKLNQVIAFTKPDNEKAIILLNRNGFQVEEGLTEGYLKFVYRAN
ncbi:GNAT family N-acetyltransferase [Fluviicola sp.]|uniref:GNAT family N-acetyltransferase n=1 Tax=Fluviicola sp. TaxID=1917219 RepID=UPI00261322EE|nr:GNAT family N-acetyltransferase [Fluviicola sp.]